MSSRKHWKLTDFLMATPYGREDRDTYPLSEEDFYHDFFIEPPLWKGISQEMGSFFNNEVGIKNINSVLLYGYQGTGKTTFLHWVLKKCEIFNSYNKMILDMETVLNNTELRSATDPDSYAIFDIYFRQQLCEIYEERPTVFVGLVNLLLDHFLRLRNSAFGTSFWDGLTSLKEVLKTPDSETPDLNDKQTIANFLDGLKYTDTFLLFILLYVRINNIDFSTKYGFKKDVSKDQLLIVFDNIDDVRMEQTNADFPAKIADLYEQLKIIFKNLGLKNTPILYFIYSVRDYNYSLLKLQTSDFR